MPGPCIRNCALDESVPMVKVPPVHGVGVEVTLPVSHAALFEGCVSPTVGGVLLQSRMNFGSAGAPNAASEAGATNSKKTATHRIDLTKPAMQRTYGPVEYVISRSARVGSVNSRAEFDCQLVWMMPLVIKPW